jgi:hypothetical protein
MNFLHIKEIQEQEYGRIIVYKLIILIASDSMETIFLFILNCSFIWIIE